MDAARSLGLATLVLVALLLGACDRPPDPGEESRATRSATLEPALESTPESAPDVAPAPAPEMPPAPAPDEVRCPDDVTAAVTDTIAGQLAAFAADDYAGALAFASLEFQAGISLPEFRALIEVAYPQVADSRDHAVLGCGLVAPGVSHALVTVTGQDGSRARLTYVLVVEGHPDVLRWAVAGAAEHSDGAGVQA